jgi:hypothetical protein
LSPEPLLQNFPCCRFIGFLDLQSQTAQQIGAEPNHAHEILIRNPGLNTRRFQHRARRKRIRQISITLHRYQATELRFLRLFHQRRLKPAPRKFRAQCRLCDFQ